MPAILGPNSYVPEYKIMRGLDGAYYAVFKDNYELTMYNSLVHTFIGHSIHCFGQYENAVYLGTIH